MNNSQARTHIKKLRENLASSATPNMLRSIANKAPIAALVYGLALIDMLAGFYYGVQAIAEIKRQGKKGDGVGLRYEKFIEKYMSPAHSGKDVEQAITASPEPSVLKNFKAWWDEGYSVLVSITI